MSVTMIVVLFLCGLVAMVIELFIPGGILGTIGFLAAAGMVVYAFASGHTATGGILTGAILAFIPVWFLLWKEVLGRFMAITDSEKDFRSGTEVNDSLMGKQGTTVTSLHPTGVAIIDDRRYHVMTRGEMVDKGARVEVIDTTGNRTVVKEV